MSDLVLHSETLSHHGSEKGTWMRFFLQPKDLASSSFCGAEFDRRAGEFFSAVMPEIINFYDIHEELIALIEAFRIGVNNGTFYTVDARGSSRFDRSLEIRIRNLVKDFFIRGKVTLMSFANSGLLEDEANGFSFKRFYFCNEKKFTTITAEYGNLTDSRYLPIINLMGRANGAFLGDFNKIRGAIEHELFRLDKFTLLAGAASPTIVEPKLNGVDLSEALTHFYESILDFIEKTTAYFFGIMGELKSPWHQLHVRHDFNYSKSYYKYIFSLGGMPIGGGDTTRCLFD
ncbi:hypothetical protein JAO73_01365 [Hymenobacter sp. BT523]|uniref:hypothetical protein n=1 Tax=Hymenobacter sp. BT523 TaxID=2795725 RepID=UPI0018EE4161|nr:hypothetical protein [Hymenobacter sp. BT523]MBJ6107641.1 hypothetical protein [Hymenobacter sp. BT523]